MHWEMIDTQYSSEKFKNLIDSAMYKLQISVQARWEENGSTYPDLKKLSVEIHLLLAAYWHSVTEKDI